MKNLSVAGLVVMLIGIFIVPHVFAMNIGANMCEEEIVSKVCPPGYEAESDGDKIDRCYKEEKVNGTIKRIYTMPICPSGSSENSQGLCVVDGQCDRVVLMPLV